MSKTVKRMADPMNLWWDKEKPEKPDPAVAPDPEATAADKARKMPRKKRTGRTSTALNTDSNLG